jgi:hypothetical protein
MIDRHRRHVGLVLAVTLLAHAAYAAVWGIRFNVSALGSYLQFVDPELLRHDLWRSIHYLRDQPPLFNLVIGLVLKTFPSHWGQALNALYFGAALAMAATLFTLLRRMRVAPWLAATVTLVFVNGPIAILHENFLFYTYPVALLVCLTLNFLHAYLVTRRTRDAALLFAALGALVLTRGLFHPLWLVATAAALMVLERARRRAIALAALVPALVVAGWMVKHYLVFHTVLAGRSLQQLNLGLMTVWRLPEAERVRLARSGTLTAAAVVPFGSPIARYLPHIRAPEPTGIPVLDEPVKSTGGVNLNHTAFIAIAELYGADGRVMMQTRPELYRAALADNVRRYVLPSDQTTPFFLDPYDDGVALRGLLRAYNFALAGQLRSEDTPWGHWVAFPALWIGTAFGAWRTLRRAGWRAAEEPSVERATALTQLYGLGAIVAMALLTVVASFGDQPRYRFEVAAAYCMLLALALQSGLDALARRRVTASAGEARTPPETPRSA